MKNTKFQSFLKGLFKNDDTRFMLSCGFKFMGIFFFISFFSFFIVWILLKLNNIYFESYGFFTSNEMKEAFFDNALEIFYLQLPYIFGLLIVLFFTGIYVGKILLRPFEMIGRHALAKTEGTSDYYNPDLFSDYKLLTRFSEFFFRYLDERMAEKKLKPNTVPTHYTKIRGPQFEKVFFFHFSLFILLIVIVSGFLSVFIISEMQAQMVNLSIETISEKSKSVGYFLTQQSQLIQPIAIFSVGILSIAYVMLGFHLYGKVSGAVFGFFATMRAFMKGNFKARVHLIGYAQIRPHGRALNKYLDYIERECVKE